ncbi:MAG: hypothetical protein HY720_15130 [Planctomycetes bacterium]|nr:hypothetical protein [Planctomycetota bacterium]
MATYHDLDWLYAVPCRNHIHRDVAACLDPWLARFVDQDPERVLEALAPRWRDAPSWLAALRDRVLEGRFPALVGAGGSAYLRTDRGATRPPVDRPWVPRKWLSPSGFIRAEGLDYLARAGYAKDELRGSSDLAVEDLVREHWSFYDSPEVPGDEGDGDSLYISPPVDPEVASCRVRELGFEPGGPVAEFVRLFDGLREAPPLLAGGFLPVQSWAREGDGSGRVAVFLATTGDRVLTCPDGRTGFWTVAQGRYEEGWETFEGFVGAYARFLARGEIFDSHAYADWRKEGP